MKVILFFLSSLFLIACKGENTNKEAHQKQAFNEFTYFIDQWKEGNLQQDTASTLINSFNEVNEHITVYDEGNDIDRQSILFKGASDTLFVDHLNYLTTLFGVPSESGSYKVWRIKRASKNTLEISFYPHPTESWLLALRKRSQE